MTTPVSPPVRRPPRVPRALVLGATGVAVLVTAVLAASHSSAETPKAPEKSEKKPQAPPLPVQIHVTQVEPFAPTISGTGTLLPNESVDLTAEIARKVVTVAVEDGQEVAAGQVLFELDTRDILAQMGRLRAQSRYAKASFGRYDSLSESGAVSQDARDSSKLRVEEAQAGLRELEVVLEKSRVVAPFSGTFGLRPISVGAWVAPGTPLGRLVDIATLKLDFRLPERHAADVAVGTEVTFRVDGRSDDFRAIVTAIDPAIERASRSVVVRARVPEPRGLLPGAFATVTVPLSRRDTLFVPAIAVIPSPTGSRIFLEKDGVARQVEVEVGVREPARVEIVRGLEPGARVIVTNLLRVRDGASVSEVKPEGPSAAKQGAR